MNRSPGATIAMLTLLLLVGGGARGQVSPGPLSQAHATIDGNRSCLECHGSGSASLDRNCLACHEEIRWLVEHDRGLHAAESDGECADCHPEHAGREFELIEWPGGSEKRFDHARAGWPLEGRHALLDCRKCHASRLRTGAVPSLTRRTDVEASWLGLEPACVACHQDPHRDSLGDDCRRCHTASAWSDVGRFDHARSAYPLAGKHTTVKCERCHPTEGETAARYRPVVHDDCSSCHEDVHRGRLAGACSACHRVEGFEIVDRATFDHASTHFPLRDKHLAVTCERCHDPERAWGARPAHDRCAACHTDAHDGQATLAGRAADCGASHDARGFAPSIYTVARHADSAYPLDGKHARVACTACHTRSDLPVARRPGGKAGVEMRPKHERCRDCHTDAHAGQLSRRADGDACEACHTVDGWVPSLFGVADHAPLSLPLEGRHLAIECVACHNPKKAGLVLQPLEAACSTCHLDPHDARFSPGGARPVGDGCAACHGVASFRPSSVDSATHARFSYPLVGAHRAVPCVECHAELSAPADPPRRLPFVAQAGDCVDCHETPHGEQFAGRAAGSGCEVCHGMAGFRPADRFDHDRDSRFALGRAHRKLSCELCHRSVDEAEGIRYLPVPMDCASCHIRRTVTRGPS